MPTPATPRQIAAAFSALERRLLERRLAALDLRTRVVALLLALCVAGLAYWKVRVPLDFAVRARGPAGGAEWLGGALALFALTGGALAAWRRSTRRVRPPGPEWLALPVPPALVARHLASEARWPAATVFAPALAALLAGIGLLPALWLVLLAAGFAVLWLEATRAGIAWAWRAQLAPARPQAALPALTRALLPPAPGTRTRPLPAPRWRRASRWRAVLALDVASSLRGSAARARLLAAAALFVVSALAWFAPAPAVVRRALAFAAFAPACAALGAWAIARTCTDPPGAIRSLPIGVRDLWRARATALLLALAVVTLVEVGLAAGLPAAARLALLSWIPVGFAVAVLGLQQGLAIAPRGAIAENLYVAWLGTAMLSSWLVPFVGWAVLLAAIAHSALRLPAWWRPEADA
ncbi:MAG TPA: hypothetical protein VMH61_05175 [Candidatus Acidoferrales bacterium]|nr:hypothetical protein [Candidatus Acidoferrales bacterium]